MDYYGVFVLPSGCGDCARVPTKARIWTSLFSTGWLLRAWNLLEHWFVINSSSSSCTMILYKYVITSDRSDRCWSLPVLVTLEIKNGWQTSRHTSTWTFYMCKNGTCSQEKHTKKQTFCISRRLCITSSKKIMYNIIYDQNHPWNSHLQNMFAKSRTCQLQTPSHSDRLPLPYECIYLMELFRTRSIWAEPNPTNKIHHVTPRKTRKNSTNTISKTLRNHNPYNVCPAGRKGFGRIKNTPGFLILRFAMVYPFSHSISFNYIPSLVM